MKLKVLSACICMLVFTATLFAQEKQELKAGDKCPEFKYTDVNGKEVSLSDLKGKYVYIDVWATWCWPCLGEIPHLKKLEEKMHKKKIVFVSISIDKKKADWEKMVKDDELTGIQLHNGGNQTLMEAFNITGIPRFILLDKKGKVIDPKMTRPSNEETEKTLLKLKGI